MLVPPHDAFRASSLQLAPRVNGVSPSAPRVAQLQAVRRQTLRTSGGTAGQRARVAPRSRQPSPSRELKRSTTTVPSSSVKVASAQSTRRCVAASRVPGQRTARGRRAVGARERRLQGAPVVARRRHDARAVGERSAHAAVVVVRGERVCLSGVCPLAASAPNASAATAASVAMASMNLMHLTLVAFGANTSFVLKIAQSVETASFVAVRQAARSAGRTSLQSASAIARPWRS